MKYFYFLWLSLSVCLVACEATKKEKDFSAIINQDNLYDYNNYLAHFEHFTAERKQQAKEMLAKIDLQETATEKLKQSYVDALLVCPTAEGYVGLAKILAKQPKKEDFIVETIKAMQMAEQLRAEPISEFYYETAKMMVEVDSAFKLKECSDCSSCLQAAIRTGFKDEKRIATDFMNKNLLQNSAIQNLGVDNSLIESYLKIVKPEDKEKAFFAVFDNYFYPHTGKQLVLDENTMLAYYNRTTLPLPWALHSQFADYKERVSSFRGEETPSPYPVAKLDINPKFPTYLYAINGYASTKFVLIVYSQEGKFVSSKDIAQFGSNSALLQTSVIQGSEIEVKTYKVKTEMEYKGNEYVAKFSNKEFEQLVKFTITEGQIMMK
jgi:hypothetical protein